MLKKKRSKRQAIEMACILLGSFPALATIQSQCRAADYLLTVTGPFQSFTNESDTFDGNVYGSDLPPLYDIARLTGGTFQATYHFSGVIPTTTGTDAEYDFSNTSGITFDLLDSNGAILNHGSAPSSAGAVVFNNDPLPTETHDGVTLYSFVNSVSGLTIPTALYSSPPDLLASESSFGFGGAVTPGQDYLTDLSVPLDARTYLSFPNASFNTGMIFGNGDYNDLELPYQYVETHLTYGITGVSVTTVPEPRVAYFILCGTFLMTKRRQISEGASICCPLTFPR